MAASGIPVTFPALASSGTVVSTFKLYGWVPDSSGDPTATPRAFYTDAALAVPASQGITLGASTRTIYRQPLQGIVFTVKSTDGATTYDTIYCPAINSGSSGEEITSFIAEDLTALKALTGDDAADQVQTLNRTTAGDQGGEFWRWSDSDTTTPDDVLTVRPTSISGANPGRWKLNIVGRAYTKLLPAGSAATDTAILQAAMAAGGVYELKPYSTWLINAPCPPVSNTRLIGNSATIQVQVGTGGFDSKNRGDKFNQNSQNTCLFLVGTAGGTVERENVEFHDLTFSASASTERVLQLIQAVEGFDDSQFHVSDILIKDINCHGGGGFIGCHSLGDGSALIENIRAQDCNITSDSGWTGAVQLTIVEIDSDLTDGPSQPGYIRGVRGKNIVLTSSALSTYGAESDLVTLAGVILTGKCGAWHVSDLLADGIGEVLDCFANGAVINNIRGKSVANFVLKFVHGARYCVASNISGSGIGQALITFQGTGTASSGDTMRNVVSGFTVEDFDTASASAVLFAKNTGTVGLPKNNLCMGGVILGDANMDYMVKDNVDSDQNCNNQVKFVDGSAWNVATVNVAYPDNTRVSMLRQTFCRIELGAGQTIATATNTTVDFSSVIEDLEGIAVAASDKVTVVRPGRYFVAATCRWTDLNGDEEVFVRVLQNTTVKATAAYTQSVSGDTPAVTAIGVIDIQEDDIGTSAADISCQVRQETGGNRTIGAAAGITQLVITRID